METDEYLTFIETSIFEKQRRSLMSDEAYQLFQTYLLEHHELGDFIPHTGGCQKIRWKLSDNKGKSGGVRVIYYTLAKRGKLFLMMMYAKSRQDNMTEKEKAILRNVILLLNEA